LRPPNAKSGQECEEGSGSKHFELILRDWNDPHSGALGVAQVRHVEVAPKQDRVFLRLLVLFMLQLDLLEICAHGLHVSYFNFALVSLAQMLHKLSESVSYESVLERLVLTLLAEQIGGDFLRFCHRPLLQLQQLRPIVALLV